MYKEDVYLLNDLAKGNQSAFAQIYKQYSLSLYQFIYRKLVDKSLAESLTNDLFLALIHYAKEWQNEPSLKAHLYNVIIKRFDKEQLQAQSSENLDLIPNTLSKLDSHSVNILLLHQYQGLSYLEIADVLKSNKKEIKEKIFFIKESLAESLLINNTQENTSKCELTCQLQAFLDKEIPNKEIKELELHIPNCTICQETLNNLTMVSENLNSWSIPEPAIKSAKELFSRGYIKPSLAQKFLSRPSLKYSGASLILLLFVFFYLVPKDLFSGAVSVKPSLPVASRVQNNVAEPQAIAQPSSLDSSSNIAVESGVVGGVVGGIDANIIPTHSYSVKSAPTLSINMAVREPASPPPPPASASVSAQNFEPPDMRMSKSQLKEGERLIIKAASMAVDTDNFDDAKNSIADLAKAKGGYLVKLYVNTESNGRMAQIVFRVPSRNFDQTIIDLRKYGKITQELIEGQDVTDKYFDAIEEVESDKVIDKALTEDSTKRNYSQVSLEQQRQALRRHTLQLKRYISELRSGADLATITFNLRETNNGLSISTKDLSAWAQIKQSFFNGFSNLFAILLPILLFVEEAGFSIIFFGAVALVIYLLVDRYTIKNSSNPPSNFGNWQG